MFRTILTAFTPTTIDLENWLLFTAVMLVALGVALGVSGITGQLWNFLCDFTRGL